MEIEQSITDNNTRYTPRPDSRSYNFWVASGPFFETSIFLSALPSGPEPASVTCGIKIFDADGAVINNVTVQISSSKTELIELEPFMEACKMESGIKHASVYLTASAPVQAFCRIFSRDSASCFSNLMSLNNSKKLFMPLSLGKDKTNLVALVNYSNEAASVKCKIFLPKRSPESQILIPARGSRILSIESEFSDLFDNAEDEAKEADSSKKIPAYLRLTAKNEGELGALLVEKLESLNNSSVFSVLAGGN